jgi:hypothetical protein
MCCLLIPVTSSFGQSFQNTSPITINDAAPGLIPREASPFPSQITVPAGSGTVSTMEVTLNGLTHANPDDVDVLLSGPGGVHNVVLMSDAGGSANVTGQTITFDDAAPGPLPDAGQLEGGSYTTSNYGEPDDGFTAPPGSGAPGTPYDQSLSRFAGEAIDSFGPAWNLYVLDDTDNGASGSISGGWGITFRVPENGASRDTRPPDTKILKGPKKRTHKRKAKIHFGSSEPAAATFVCTIDDGGPKPCKSPERLKVGRGKHRFGVQAVDAAGNIDPTPAERKWRVKREKRETDGNDGK